MRFKGKLAVLGETPAGKSWALANEAMVLEYGALGFSDQAADWSGPARVDTVDSITMNTPKPQGWPAIPNGCQNYALVLDGKYRTGYPIRSVDKNRIDLVRFPLLVATHCTVPSFYYQESC